MPNSLSRLRCRATGAAFLCNTALCRTVVDARYAADASTARTDVSTASRTGLYVASTGARAYNKRGVAHPATFY